MAFEMDEMKKRREQRQQQRDARLARERKTRIRLVAALVVLIACGILIYIAVVAGPGSAVDNPAQTTLPVQTTQTVPETTAAREPTTVIHFSAAGDLNITDQVVASGGVAYDYTEAFMDVLPLLSDADLTAMNFEGNVCGTPYGKDSAPPQLLSALKAAGVDILQVANSKSINKGIAGLNATVQNIRAAGFDTVGAVPEGEKTGDYLIRHIRGVKVAIVAFTKGMDGMAMPVGSEDLVNLLYTDYSSTYNDVDTRKIRKILRAVAKEEPDITIAMVHWGSEYSDIHSDSQTDIRDLLLSEGVDAIIGTHPHYVQEMVFDENAGTFVAYSLGDFYGDAQRTGTAYSVVLDLEITKDNLTGETKVTGYSYTPIYTVQDTDGTLRVMRLQEAITAYEEGRIDRVSEETYNSMVYGLDRIEDRVQPPEETEPEE